jgi:outer membrane protein TolC
MPRKTLKLWLDSRRALAVCGLGVCGLAAGCASPEPLHLIGGPPSDAARRFVPAVVSDMTAAASDAARHTPRAVDELKSAGGSEADELPVLTTDRAGDSKATAPVTVSDQPDWGDGKSEAAPPPSLDASSGAAHGAAAPHTVDRPVYPTDFGSALMTAGGQNPRIGFAHGRIREAFAQLEQAEVLWLPSIRAGASFNRHDGTIQDARGNVFDVSRSSFYHGLGARAVGGGSPAFHGLYAEFHIADACIQPKIAGQVAAARNHAAIATTNDVLLETALAYLDLLEALQLQAIAAETLDRATRLAEVTASFAKEGEAPQSDADRARTELSFRRIDIEQATEGVDVASARLAQLLSIDAAVCIVPQEPTVVPIELVPCESDPHDLVAVGLSNRHEVAESRHLVAAACERLRREKTAPLVPSIILGASYGGFGGGRGGFVGDYGDRFDLDAVAYWEVRNLCFGERAARAEAAANVDQAHATVIRQMDQVAREVVEAHAQVRARSRQIAVAQAAIVSARDAYRRDLERIRAGQGLPIEVLQSLQALDAALREYVRAVVDYNEAQFRLHRALGWPVQH